MERTKQTPSSMGSSPLPGESNTLTWYHIFNQDQELTLKKEISLNFFSPSQHSKLPKLQTLTFFIS